MENVEFMFIENPREGYWDVHKVRSKSLNENKTFGVFCPRQKILWVPHTRYGETTWVIIAKTGFSEFFGWDHPYITPRGVLVEVQKVSFQLEEVHENSNENQKA